MRFAVALLPLIWILPLPASANTGNDLYRLCGAYVGEPDPNRQAEIGLCLGYVRGAGDAFNAMGQFCLPAQSTVDQWVAVIYRWMEQHPERRHESQLDIVRTALSEAFPCPQQ